MDDASSEILGYSKTGRYDDVRTDEISTQFNADYSSVDDKFAPIMLRLCD